jgi:hypothetical protein
MRLLPRHQSLLVPRDGRAILEETTIRAALAAVLHAIARFLVLLLITFRMSRSIFGRITEFYVSA